MLAGGTATLPGLKDRVTELTGFASMVVNPFENMKLGSAVREAKLRREASSYLTACGLAMRRFRSVIMINLLAHREERRQRRKIAYYAGLGGRRLAGVAIVGVWYLVVEQMIAVQQARNAFLQSEIAKLEIQIKDIASLKAEIASLKARQKAVEDLQIDRNVPVHVLNELVRQVPEGIYITSVSRTGRTSTSPASRRRRSACRSCCATPPTAPSGWSSLSWCESKAAGASAVNRTSRSVCSISRCACTVKRPQDGAASPRRALRRAYCSGFGTGSGGAAPAERAGSPPQEGLSIHGDQKQSGNRRPELGFEGAASQFRGLNPNEPGQWPLLPKAMTWARSLRSSASCRLVLPSCRARTTSSTTEHAKEPTLKTDYRAKLAQAVNLSELRKQKLQVEEYVTQLEKQLPGKAEMDALLSDINQAGLGRGLQFELFRPGQVVRQGLLRGAADLAQVAGRYHDIGSFAADIAESCRGSSPCTT
jgi:type IV pilus assembly protein PilO